MTFLRPLPLVALTACPLDSPSDPNLQARLDALEASRDDLQEQLTAQQDALEATNTAVAALQKQVDYAAATALTFEDVAAESAAVVAADASLARKDAGQSFVFTYGSFKRVGTDVTWTTPDGVAHFLDTAGMVDGELRENVDKTIALQNGAAGADSTLYLDIDQMPSVSCALFHFDDDITRSVKFATNVNDGIWSDDVLRDTARFGREGATGDLPDGDAHYRVVCF